MPETYESIAAAIRDLEHDLARRQQALDLLRQALKLMEAQSGQVQAQISVSPAKEGLASHIDRYLATLQDGDGFTVEDVTEAVVATGMDDTRELRSKISSLLARKAKSGRIERVGPRGSYAKPDKVYEETEDA